MGIQLNSSSMQKSDKKYDFGFFKLENNHDKAIVRILHENYEDFSRRPVHNVIVPEYKYGVTINCLRDDSDSLDKCPFCTADMLDKISKRRKKVYIEFLVYKTINKDGKVIDDYSSEPRRMVWERDRRFDDKIFSLSSRYPRLCDVVFQVERFGEKGSTDTQYDIYQIDVNRDDYPYELPEKLYNPDGIQVLDKTFDEMNYYIENGDFPPTDDEGVSRRADIERNAPENPVPSVPLAEINSQQNAFSQQSTTSQQEYVAQPQPTVQPQTVTQPTRRRI